jgi:hypothetical protein
VPRLQALLELPVAGQHVLQLHELLLQQPLLRLRRRVAALQLLLQRRVAGLQRLQLLQLVLQQPLLGLGAAPRLRL